jgi:hypothetical protein
MEDGRWKMELVVQGKILGLDQIFFHGKPKIYLPSSIFHYLSMRILVSTMQW